MFDVETVMGKTKQTKASSKGNQGTGTPPPRSSQSSLVGSNGQSVENSVQRGSLDNQGAGTGTPTTLQLAAGGADNDGRVRQARLDDWAKQLHDLKHGVIGGEMRETRGGSKMQRAKHRVQKAGKRMGQKQIEPIKEADERFARTDPATQETTGRKMKENVHKGNAYVNGVTGTMNNLTLAGQADNAVQALEGDPRHAGKPMSRKRAAVRKGGQVLEAGGNILGQIPVAGGALGMPLNFLGKLMTEHSKGRSKKEALLNAGSSSLVSAVTGIIPGYSNYEAGVGFAQNVADLTTAADFSGAPGYVKNVEAKHAKLAKLHNEMENAFTTFQGTAEFKRFEKLRGKASKERYKMDQRAKQARRRLAKHGYDEEGQKM